MTTNQIGALLTGTLLAFLLACNGVTADDSEVTADTAAAAPDTAAAAVAESDVEEVEQAAEASGGLPDAPGKEETMQGCLAGCHQMSIFNQNYTPQEWQQCVNDMINLGAPITEETYMPIVMYLAKNLVEEQDAP